MIWGWGRACGFWVSFLRDDCWPGSCLRGDGAGYGAIPGFGFGLYLGYCFFECCVSFGDAAQASCVSAFCLDLNICGVLVFAFH